MTMLPPNVIMTNIKYLLAINERNSTPEAVYICLRTKKKGIPWNDDWIKNLYELRSRVHPLATTWIVKDARYQHQPLWRETDLSSQPTGNPFTSSSGGNFDETFDSFLGDQVPEFTSQPLWWETDLSSQPIGNPFTSSSGGNFDEMVASFQGGQVSESTSQPLWWETDLSSQPTGTISPPLLVETLMRRLLFFRDVKSQNPHPNLCVGNRFELPTHREPFHLLFWWKL
ncbi:hypothetical protein CK203_099754 [Vitis vinifera]|uniref:Uncharacterized protein n=1 Tax=Vitis vinifera TaxID=29760 RepID=A0A438CYP9_VITVI|nr:hypothetical protein CK203_099754 [Vitis vinifera]